MLGRGDLSGRPPHTRAARQLFKAIDKGEPWAIKLFLTTIGRPLGYTTKPGVGHDGETLKELVLSSQSIETRDRGAGEGGAWQVHRS